MNKNYKIAKFIRINNKYKAYNDEKEIIKLYEKEVNDLQSKIDKAIEYYETHQQECVIGRNRDDKLIKDYYLPSQFSKKLYDILKEVE